VLRKTYNESVGEAGFPMYVHYGSISAIPTYRDSTDCLL